MLATDGAWEPLGNDGEEYGIPRMLELVRSHRDRPAREIIETLSRDVQQFARRQLDDMTIVVVKVLGAE